MSWGLKTVVVVVVVTNGLTTPSLYLIVSVTFSFTMLNSSLNPAISVLLEIEGGEKTSAGHDQKILY